MLFIGPFTGPECSDGKEKGTDSSQVGLLTALGIGLVLSVGLETKGTARNKGTTVMLLSALFAPHKNLMN